MLGTTDPPADHAPDRLADLEHRVRRLETAVAERPPPPPDEDAVADRVIAKLSAYAGEPRPLAPSGDDRVLVLDHPPAAPLPPPPPNGAVLHPPKPPADPADRRWFLSQFAAEVRLIVRMYLDPRYRLSRTAQFALPAVLLLLVFDYFLFSWFSVPVLSPVLERVLAVVLGVVGYKILTRETARYREVLDYMSRYAR